MPDKRWINIKIVVLTSGQEDMDYRHNDEFRYVIEGRPGAMLYSKIPLALRERQKLQNDPAHSA
jgi:hypothetical protein